MLYNLHFFSSKCRLFHNATLFGFCITHILNIWKKFENLKKKIRRQKVKYSILLERIQYRWVCADVAADLRTFFEVKHEVCPLF